MTKENYLEVAEMIKDWKRIMNEGGCTLSLNDVIQLFEMLGKDKKCS